MLNILFKGIIIGLITGMPLGPIGALCMRTTIANGISFGIAAGLGSCVADSIYASIAAMGITVIARFLAKHQKNIRIFGGIILMFFGIHTILSKKENKQEIPNSKTLSKSFLSTFLLSFANPSTVFSFLLVFTSYGSKNIGHGLVARIFLIIGVFCGSLIWWVILVSLAGKFHKNLNIKKLNVVNRVLGSAIVFSGIVLIISITNYKKYTLTPYLHIKLFEKVLHVKFTKFFH
jgi:threonine/homoserine/homoserine lactone efflux protein